MESDEDSRSSSNSSGSSGSSASNSRGPSSPPRAQENESNDQPEPGAGSRPSSPDSNSSQDKSEATKKPREQNQQPDEEELELSDLEEPKKDNHEDLSDISDMESNSPAPNFTDLRHKLDKQRMNGAGNKKNDEDELDFEDDESAPVSSVAKSVEVAKEDGEKSADEEGEHKTDDEGEAPESGEELEEGEVTDGDDKRPEESEPKAVCRFFTRGQCTWGMSCRFLHPGTTDKGNYTMFDMVRPIPVPQAAPMPMYDYRNERPPLHHIPPHAFGHHRLPPAGDSESAWERGLRTAKEMMRKASKRKEQDIDFDEKKMNLSGPPDEFEKDPYYRGSPEIGGPSKTKATPPFERIPRDRYRFDYSPPPAKFARGPPGHFEEDPFGRVPRYRELPPHRMPHYEDDGPKRRMQTSREVIVEKNDDWVDPWARKSRRGGSGARDRGRERSYSSSYSSSSGSSRSRSSSESSGSPSPSRRKRFDSQRSKERNTPRKHVRPRSRSSSPKRRHSSPARSRGIEKKPASPITKRKKLMSPPPARLERSRSSYNRKKQDSSSGSGSSSGSESESSYSSSTSDSKGKKRREKLVAERKPVTKAVEVTKKRVSPPKDDKKDKASAEKAAAAAKLKSTRREELLKQLKAVEDAIARKKSKIN